MDLILICHDADAASVVGNALLASEAAKAGSGAGILFSGDALLGLLKGWFPWPRGFWPQSVRWAVADRAGELGIPIRGKGQWRDIDVGAILEWVRGQNVRFFACPVWGPLLTPDESWPPTIEVLSPGQALTLLKETTTVIGSF
jgi:hypothetical protein